MSFAGPSVSIVIPVYNEADILRETVEETLAVLDRFMSPVEFELLIAENGSTDDTLAIAEQLAESHEQVRVIVKADAGRGRALDEAARAARGQTVGYFDADLATDMDYLEELIESVRRDGYDLATGSRYLPDSVADRPFKRRFPSKGFNTGTRWLLGSSLSDHQCGFKAFDRDVLLDLLPDVRDTHWFWDTEVLVRAQRRGYTVKEFPVEWEPKPDSKVDIAADVLGMGGSLLRTWWELDVRPHITPRATTVAGTLLILLAVLVSPYYLDYGLLFDRLTSIDPVYVGLGAIAYLVSLPVRGVRYRIILGSLRASISTTLATGSIFISQTANFVVPARAGDAARAYIVKMKAGVDYTNGFTSLVIERLFDLLTIVGLSVIGLAGLAAADGVMFRDVTATVLRDGSSAARIGVLVAAGVGVAVLLAFGAILYVARKETNLLSPLRGRVNRDSYTYALLGELQRAGSNLQTAMTDSGTAGAVLALSVVVWTIDVATALIVVAGFGLVVHPVVVLAVVVAVSVGNLSKVLPLTPGGIGLYEGVFAGIVIATAGVSWEMALSIALVDHAIKNGVTTVGGFVSVLALNVPVRDLLSAPDSENVATNADLEDLED